MLTEPQGFGRRLVHVCVRVLSGGTARFARTIAGLNLFLICISAAAFLAVANPEHRLGYVSGDQWIDIHSGWLIWCRGVPDPSQSIPQGTEPLPRRDGAILWDDHAAFPLVNRTIQGSRVVMYSLVGLALQAMCIPALTIGWSIRKRRRADDRRRESG